MSERSEDLSLFRKFRETFVDRVIAPSFQEYRSNGQIIEDPLVIEAFRSVDRGLFVSNGTNIQEIYADNVIPLQAGSTISQPSLVALMMHGLQLNGKGKVLEVGTASGYGAALLSHCADEVHTIECEPSLADRARELLGALGYHNVTVHTGDGLRGVSIAGPFDRIIVTAGLRKIPKLLIDQLTEGGIIIAPVGDKNPQIQDIIQGLKHGKRLQSRLFLEGITFVPALSPEKGGWTPKTYDRATKSQFERKITAKKPILEKEIREISPEELEEAELLISNLKLLDPISRQIEDRIKVLMDQGLSYDRINEDPELMRLEAAARSLKL